MRHDSRIRSDHLNVGLSRGKAEKLAAAVNERLGYPGIGANHSGRRDAYSCDRASATTPGGWKDTHERGSTIKLRGCSAYRHEAARIARELLNATDAPSVPSVVRIYFGSNVAHLPKIVEAFHPERGWQQVEGATLQQLRAAGCTRVAYQLGVRTADFSIRELVSR